MARFSTYTIAFLNGVLLLCLELVSSKAIAPYFGNSYQVWSTMLFVTLFAICAGYFISEKLTRKKNPLKFLTRINLLAILAAALTYFTYERTLSSLVGLSFYGGLLASFLLLFFPLFTLICTQTPLLIDFYSEKQGHSPQTTGRLLFVSTLGGVFGVYFFGLYFIPYIGIRESFWVVAAILLLITALLFLNLSANGKK